MLQQARFPRAAAARPLSFLSFLLCENEPAGQLGRRVRLVTREDRLATEVRGQASEKFSSLGLLLRSRTGPPRTLPPGHEREQPKRRQIEPDHRHWWRRPTG